MLNNIFIKSEAGSRMNQLLLHFGSEYFGIRQNFHLLSVIPSAFFNDCLLSQIVINVKITSKAPKNITNCHVRLNGRLRVNAISFFDIEMNDLGRLSI